MMTRLQAEEQIAAVSAAALGSGAMKRADARRIWSRLERAADGGAARRARPTPDMLATIGVRVVAAPAPAAAPDESARDG